MIIFEDELWPHFGTIAQTRPLFALRVGALTLMERGALLAVQYGTNEPMGLARSHLMDCFGPTEGLAACLRVGAPVVLINARALDLAWLPELLKEPLNTVYLAGECLLGARITPALASAVLFYLQAQQAAAARDELLRFARFRDVGPAEPPLLLRYPWDLISQTGEQIVRDLALLEQHIPRLHAPPPQVTVRGEQIYVAPTARLDGPIVLDGRDGPIFIEAEAQIEPFSFIQGPAYIGAGSLIASARIRGETAIGPVCRIGGEVEASIVQGFSNKHHDGFLGHSWLGEWVNIGAMTTNSDLKNNYGHVRVNLEGVGQFDSGLIKLGVFLADHVKLGIGMHLNGGTMIGTGSNIFGLHSLPKNIPPFTWGGDVFREYRIENMIGVTRTVMGRRKRTLTPGYEALLRAAFELTRPAREHTVPPAVIPISPAAALALARAEAEAVGG
ncbi:putative sugar nucleotidyl transferase [Candidatus Viridilinea mediisalina]|uniref:Glucose-1-phosphate thymidylyltransferase n=1 Tax=Candidatus Viridilinea mediisalina TaxID=2024553 RepID=A0A2A6REA0_9CHLR|nr:putative sugar nucleotidyl transferase [Candidatus Viridilinea mediisalina]PDW00623.1 hypothetical protein CJ255_20490 [Candidatus Viridilinea mediisalina]